MRSQEMIKYEKKGVHAADFQYFQVGFSVPSDHFRPPGTQNEEK